MLDSYLYLDMEPTGVWHTRRQRPCFLVGVLSYMVRKRGTRFDYWPEWVMVWVLVSDKNTHYRIEGLHVDAIEDNG